MADTDGGEKRINLGDKETCHLKCETTTSGFVTSNEHQQYILQRHGTLELDPLPSSSPNDPLNWPVWKKNTQLLMVAFHAMMATFMAAGIIPGFQSFSVNYGITIEEASYLTSVQILVLGVWPLFWNPISKHFGRRPVFLISTIGSCICNIGGAFCTSYGAQMSTRILTAILICPPLGIGSGVVTELFFRREHAQKLGWWTLLLTIGIPLGPFIMGFVVQHLRVNWIFGILAIINFCQFLGYLWLQVLVPTCAYAVVLCYANIAIVVEMPIIFGEKFGLDAQNIGLQYIALIIGSVLGEQLSRRLSDLFLARYAKRAGHSDPVHRLWFSYVGFGTVIIGILVWGIQLQNAENGVWNVTPLVGAAIASFGNQIITTTLIAFAVDSYSEKSTDIGVAVNFIRQVWGFIGPFYFPLMFRNLGFSATAGVFVSIIFAFGFVPVAWLHFQKRQSKWVSGVA